MDLVVSLKYLRYGRRIRWICFETVLHVKCRKFIFIKLECAKRGARISAARSGKNALAFFFVLIQHGSQHYNYLFWVYTTFII